MSQIKADEDSPEVVRIKASGPSSTGVTISSGGKPLSGVTRATWTVDSETMLAALELHLDCWEVDVDLKGEPRYFVDVNEFDAGAIPLPEGIRRSEAQTLGGEIRRAVGEAYYAGQKRAYKAQGEALVAAA